MACCSTAPEPASALQCILIIHPSGLTPLEPRKERGPSSQLGRTPASGATTSRRTSPLWLQHAPRAGVDIQCHGFFVSRVWLYSRSGCLLSDRVQQASLAGQAFHKSPIALKSKRMGQDPSSWTHGAIVRTWCEEQQPLWQLARISGNTWTIPCHTHTAMIGPPTRSLYNFDYAKLTALAVLGHLSKPSSGECACQC